MAESQTTETQTRRRRNSRNPPLSFRLVLVGKTGVGKSSSGNTILGRDAFRADDSQSSVTSECSKQENEVCGFEVSVVDTPGIFDTTLAGDALTREISKCINMSAPGPHAFLLVIEAGRFRPQDGEAVRKVEEIFGEGFWKYTIVLFTHGDRVKVKFEQMLEKATDDLQQVLKKAENRYHVFNNNQTNDRGQVLHLLQKVEKMVEANRGECYSNPTYLETVQMLDQRETELREIYWKKLEEDTEAMRKKYEEMLSEAQQERQQERQQLEKQRQMELEELQRYYDALQRGVRHVVEKIMASDPSEEMMKRFHETLRLT